MRLRTEILISMIAVVVVTTVTLAAASYVFSMRNEAQLLSESVNREIGFVLSAIERSANPQLPETSDLKVWIDAPQFVNAPALFRGLALGETHDVEYLGRRWHVVRRATRLGLMTAAHDVTQIEAREAQLRVWIVAATSIGCLLGLVLAFWLSRRIGQPIGQLADAVDHLDPESSQHVLPLAKRKELRSIARAVDALQARQRAVLQRERLFSAAASHELRTPIAIIRSAFELADKMSVGASLSPPLQRARRAVDTLGDLVDSLLFVAREQPAPNGTLDRVALEPIVRNVCDELAPQVSHVALSVEAERVQDIACNPTHVRIVLVNLLRNAAQHSTGGQVRVVLQSSSLSVIDQGDGLPAGLSLDALMQPYVSTAAATGDPSRYGLGLYVVGRICSHYGWALTASRHQGGGTVMAVQFHP